MIGSVISFASGDYEVGYAGSAAGSPIISQALTPTSAEFIVENTTIVNGGFMLKDWNQAGSAVPLFLTDVSGALALEPLVFPEAGTQGFGFVCYTCNDPTTVGAGEVLASACNIVSGWSGQCLQIQEGIGSPVELTNCQDLGLGSQYFDVYLA
ncbi:hypothetical protein B0H11DRAFT_1926438 [Mycena galericulata]|nr:hypothetical protein B0H11DRAFT_1926438 [Mycena galericulata]